MDILAKAKAKAKANVILMVGEEVAAAARRIMMVNIIHLRVLFNVNFALFL